MSEKKTKVIATLGPASEDAKTIGALVDAGVDVFRCNLSHGDHAEHRRRIKIVQAISKKKQTHTGILIDLCGPKIRIGDFKEDTITLQHGREFVLITKPIVGDEHRVWVNYVRLPQEVSKGDTILVDDGKCRLTVLSTSKYDIRCRVVSGGVIRGRRGISVPDAHLSMPSLTVKDKQDIRFGASIGADFFAISFVRSADDIFALQRLLRAAHSTAAIVAKMETRQAVENADEITAAADVIMVARGDLAVETSPEEVPLIQKNLIRKANHAGKPVITATQMLESMTSSAVPTRAEVSDIANAILDGTDAVMLSGETALGSHPIAAVKVMERVALRVERDYLHRKLALRRRSHEENHYVTDSVTSAAVSTADTVGSRFIVALTKSGRTARMLSRHKPSQHIISMTPDAVRARIQNLSFGVHPAVFNPPKDFDNVLSLIRRYFLTRRFALKGETIVIVCGLPFGKAIDTNMVLVEKL